MIILSLGGRFVLFVLCALYKVLKVLSPSLSLLYHCQEYSPEFLVLSRVARDILAIPGVSVAVERLFSHCRQTMTELRSAMDATTAAKAVVSKDLLKDGLGEGLDYLEGRKIWNTRE